jgi:Ca2+/Na+ antiporter
MDSLLILLVIAAIIILLAVLTLIWMWKRKWKNTVDYQNYFNIGVIWIASGIVMYFIFQTPVGFFFLVVGVVYLVIGYKNRDKWGIPQETNPAVQKRLMIAITTGIILFVLGMLVLIILF